MRFDLRLDHSAQIEHEVKLVGDNNIAVQKSQSGRP
jgi:hypothetical protein